ncbi:SDR family NAD(P)-dependent oxidoreductase [Vibrio fluvialis]|uniref:SDR family NAD(P)-dependent oxidoreductase n=1 Tax=Vibrio fluvialis TaxID=676 RepID=UPI00192A8A59|nr:SDR family oxidoreductase [Vibrio fluvialis]MBL4281492.1 SDR family oxidoreductase [Vibrio fluvialis]
MNTKEKMGKALITGASSGIGATYAKRLSERGYDLLLVARSKDKLDELATEIQFEHDVEVETLKADLTNSSDLKKVIERLEQDRTITLFLNNAGIPAPGSLLDSKFDTLSDVIDLNVKAASQLAVAAGKNFRQNRNGKIINISSVLALMPEQVNGVYSASKSYVLVLAQALANELKPFDVQVQAVLPGATRTAIWEKSGVDINQLPPEMIMEVEDMVDAALEGLDNHELVTIPPLKAPQRWQELEAARLNVGPFL